jgi:hypothetical protein
MLWTNLRLWSRPQPAGAAARDRPMALEPRRQPRGHPWLDLRDGLTALVVKGLHDPEAAAALEALDVHVASILAGTAGGAPVGEAAGEEAPPPASGDPPASAVPPLIGPGVRRLRDVGIIGDDGRLRPEAYRHLAYLRDRCAMAARARAGLQAPQPPELEGVVPEVLAAVWLLRAGLYFEAHDQLEAHWGPARGETRLFYQGIIQVAVALEHLVNGNRAGAVSLMEGALEKLEGLGRERAGLDLDRLREGIRRTLAAIRDGAPYHPALLPPFVAARRA